MTEPSTIFYMAMTTMSLSIVFAYTQLISLKRELARVPVKQRSK